MDRPPKNNHLVSNNSCNIGTINVATNHSIRGRKGNSHGQHHSYSHGFERSADYCHLGDQPNDYNSPSHRETHGQRNSYSHGCDRSSRYCNLGYQRSDREPLNKRPNSILIIEMVIPPVIKSLAY